MDKLTLNDSSVFVKRERSVALGYGFRCGFLGMLHPDVFRERLSQEYSVDVITTTPTIPYKLALQDDKEVVIENPCEFPLAQRPKMIEEPIVTATIITPEEFTGPVMKLCKARRGAVVEHSHLAGGEWCLDTSSGSLSWLIPSSVI